MGRFSIIPHLDRINECIALSRQYGTAFEYNDFFDTTVLDDAEETERRIRLYLGLDRDRSNDTLHGAFYDICVNSTDKRIADVSKFRIRQSMEIAKRLEVAGVIFHTSLIKGFESPVYLDGWLEGNRVFFTELCKEYPHIGIWMENMFDETPVMLAKLAKSMEVPNFGVCLDIAHAHLTSTDMGEWFKALAPYIRHFHINDNNRDFDAHLPVGEGNIEWSRIFGLIGQYGLNTQRILVEVSNYDGKAASLKYLEMNQYE